MTGFTNFLQFLASGSVLWLGLMVVTGLCTLLIFEFPLLSNIVSAVLSWPFICLGRLLAPTKLGQWIMATTVWLWLERKEFDPKAHPLSWWAVRGTFILCLWAFSVAGGYWQGQENAEQMAASRSLALIGPARIETAWKARALECEDKLPPPMEMIKVNPAPMIVTVPPLAPSTIVKGKTHKKPEKTWLEKAMGL